MDHAYYTNMYTNVTLISLLYINAELFNVLTFDARTQYIVH